MGLSRITRVLCGGVAMAAGCAGPLLGQTTLPATAPTASVSQLSSANPPAHRAASHLAVVWNGVSLQVEATNVSLNAVLHEISLKTKMKVTGTAPDERVFGTYGPGPLNLVVPALLNGVAVNLLLTERNGGVDDELLLTDRAGGPTPSYIPTQQDAEGGDGEAPVSTQQSYPRTAYRSAGRINGGLPPNGNDPVVPDNGISGRDNGIAGRDNGLNGPDNGIAGRDNGVNGTDNGLNNSSAAANAAATANSTTTDTAPASPNGVRTPQEIFEQLQRLRQQQNQTAPQ